VWALDEDAALGWLLTTAGNVYQVAQDANGSIRSDLMGVASIGAHGVQAPISWVAASHSGNGVRCINKVTLCWTQLVLGRTNHLGMQPATQANSVSYPQWDGK